MIDSKVGSFSDIHIGLNQDNPIWHDIVLKFAENVSNLYKDKKISDIIISGDVFHNRSEISLTTLHTAKCFFDFFKDFNLYILAGNHDSFYKENADVNSICLFDGWSNIKIIDKKPEVFKTKKGTKVSLIPWGTDIQNIPESDVCFGHFEINTFYMNTYRVCEKGEDSKNLLKKSPFIISGHFHKKDHRVYEKGQILYLGSPYQQNFGDYGDDRGYYIVDLDSKKFEFYSNMFSPKFIKIDSNSLDSEKIKDKIKNNFISLNLETSLKENEINSILNKLQSLSPINIKLEYEEKQETTSSDEKKYDSIDILKNIYDYVQTLDIECKEDVVNYLTEIYNTINT